jgi:hypothetical protein
MLADIFSKKYGDSNLEFKADSAGQPTGWFLKRTVVRTPKTPQYGEPKFSITSDPDGDILNLTCENASFAFWKKVDLKVASDTQLTWRWKASKVPTVAPPGLRVLKPKEKGPWKKGESPELAHAIQVLVVFERFPNAIALHYSWSGVNGLDSYWKVYEDVPIEDLPPDLQKQFAGLFDTLAMEYPHLVVQAGGPTEDWQPQIRNLADDFHRFYPDDQKGLKVIFIGVQTTTFNAPKGDQLAVTAIRNLRLVGEGLEANQAAATKPPTGR